MTDAFSDLAAFDLDADNGFLPGEDPLERLPDTFSDWERVGTDLPALLVTGRARGAIEGMAVLDPAGLSGRRAEERALLLLLYMASAYVWGGTEPARRVPASVGRPLVALAERMGRVPIIHYATTLHNWRRVEPTAPLALDNLDTPVRFLGGADERWFFQSALAVELEGRDGIWAAIEAKRAAARGEAEALVPALDRIAAAVRRMAAMLERTGEWCAPWAFYHRVRPWVASWPAPGLVYEGAGDDRPRAYAGGSAAQSALVQAIDVTLDVVHDGPDTSSFLKEMRRYMTPGHRRFLAALSEGASVRDLAARAGPAVRAAYDGAVDAVDGLRRVHTGIAVRYIINMAKDEKALGTGGTELAGFLKATRTETRAARLSGA